MVTDVIDPAKQPFTFKVKNRVFAGVYDEIRLDSGRLEEIIDSILEVDENDFISDLFKDGLEDQTTIKRVTQGVIESLATSIALSEILQMKFSFPKGNIPFFWKDFAGKLLVISTIPEGEDTPFHDVTKTVEKYIERALMRMNDIERQHLTLFNITPEEFLKEDRIDLAALQIVIRKTFELILDDLNVSFKRSLNVQRVLQPVIISEKTLAHIDKYYPDITDPEDRKKIKRILSQPIEKIESEGRLSSKYEDILLYMISELIYNIGPFEEMKVYMKPSKYASKRIELITREDGTSVLSTGVRTLQEKFKLTKEEIRWIFYGVKGKPSAVEKLSEKTFRFQGKSYTIEKVRLIDAIKEHLYEDDFELLAWRIRLHRVFTSGLEAYIKDNIERIRLLANITHPKAWKSVFTLKNMLMTIRSPIKYSYSTLIKKAGISFRKGHVEDAKETLLKHLKALQEAGYIGGIKIIDDKLLEILPPTREVEGHAH